MPSSSDDSDHSDSIGRIRSRESRDSSPRVTRPSNVILAKIFMAALDPTSCQPKEWDGTDPGHTNKLFVYADLHNTTYQSYVTLSDRKKKLVEHFTQRDSRHSEEYDKLMRTGPFSKYLESCIHNPRAYDSYRWTNSPELETLLRNLMSGTLSFVNRRDVLDRHRIYVFDMPTTLGLSYTGHPEVTNPVYTYWYRLNNSSGQDKVTQGRPDGEMIREIPEEEFTSNYKIFQNFKKANPHSFVFSRETPGLPNKYRQLQRTAGGKKHSKRRNKTRRKYRKIKNRRR